MMSIIKVFELSSDQLKKREIIRIDIANDPIPAAVSLTLLIIKLINSYI